MRGDDRAEASNPRPQYQRVEAVNCVECNSSSGLTWSGWRAYWVEDPDKPRGELAFYCRSCATREFSGG
jgi:hypothetical protein